MLDVISTKYVCLLRFDSHLSDEQTWTAKLLEFGLERETFSVTSSSEGSTILIFQESGRPEALRILAERGAGGVT